MRFFLLALLLVTGALAEPLYIRERPYTGPVSGSGSSMFAGLEALVRDMGLELLAVNGGWYVSRSQVTPEQVRVEPDSVVVEDLIVESREEAGKRLVHLKQFVLALGGEVQVESSRVSVVPPVPGRKTRRTQAGDVKAILKGPREATELPGPSPPQVLVRVNQPGQKVVLTQVLIRGKINVVYFHTPWSAACKELTPRLESFAQAHPEYVVLAVHIQRQGSPVAKQYQVKSVPAFLIYDARGRVQARGESARRQVLSLLSGT